MARLALRAWLGVFAGGLAQVVVVAALGQLLAAFG